MQQGLKQVYRYGFGLLALAAFFLLATFLFWPYAKLQELFRQFNLDKETLAPWNSFTGSYGFAESTYWLAVGGYAAVLALSLFLFFRLRKDEPNSLKTSVANVFLFFRQKLQTVWQSMPLWEKWLVSLTGLLLLGARLYFLFTSRIGGDEAASYIFFISKGLPGILFYYPLPNNHIFYNLLCLPLRFLFEDPYWVVQLPTFLLSLIGSALVYLGYRSVLPFLVVFFATVTFSFSQYALYFAVHGRGYFLVSICAALAALALYKTYQRQEENRYWLVFLVCSAVGFFTIPVYLYPFAATGIFGTILFGYARNWLGLKKLIVAGAFTGFTTLLLYSPVLLASGPGLLLGNSYVSSGPVISFFKGFAFFFTYTQGSVIGQESIGFYLWLLGFLGTSVLLVFQAYFRPLLRETGIRPAFLFLTWCSLLLPWIFVMLQRVRPPERVLFYKGFFDLLALGLVMYIAGYFILRRFPKLLLAAFLIFSAGYSAYQVRKTHRNEQMAILDEGFDARIKAILNSGVKTIFGNEISYTANLRYQFFVHGPKDFFLSEYEFNPKRDYDLLVLSKKGTVPPLLNLENFQQVFENDFVRIFYANEFLRKKQSQPLQLE